MNRIKKWLNDGGITDIEEITRTLQKIVENQAGFSGDLGAIKDQTQKLFEAQVTSESRQARLDEALQKVAEFHQMLAKLVKNQEERIDEHNEINKGIDARLNVLIEAQVANDSRAQRIEESIGRLIELTKNQEARIDSYNETHEEVKKKLNALIDAQVAYESRAQRLEDSILRFTELARIQQERNDERLTKQAEIANSQVDRITESLDQVVTLPTKNTKRIKAEVMAQSSAFPKQKTKAMVKSRKPTKKGNAAL
jgi:chromosome segregation ATPase